MGVRQVILWLIGVCGLGLIGCRAAPVALDPEYCQVSNSLHHACTVSDPVPAAMAPVHTDLEGPHAVEDYIQFALHQNPAIQAARKRIEAAAHQVAVAASLQDPTFGVTTFPEPVQTAAGQQELMLAANQKVPWFGKLETRAEVAEAQANIARANFAAVELATIEKVKRAYYDLYFVQQAIQINEAEQDLLVRFRGVALTRYQSGRRPYQDVLRAELEISKVESELIRLRQQQDSVRARLARVLHVAPHTRLEALPSLPTAHIPEDLALLQRQAVAARPELHSQLAALQRDRRSAELARLDYYPDVTLGATWIDVATAGISPVANGRDAFLLGATVNLPIYQRRLTSSLRSAEAKAVSTAREYESLKDGTQEEVLDLFVQVQSQQDLLEIFRDDILQKARQTVRVDESAYDVGEVDFLQLIDSWRELLRYEISNQRLEAGLRQALASLERVVGGFGIPPVDSYSVPEVQFQSLPPTR